MHVRASSIEIKTYTLADLEERTRLGSFWDGEVVPITKHRALSHIQNPRARPEDVALLVAYDDDSVVGYVGILPDLIFLQGEQHRVGWLTAWWANPDPKYAGVGLALMAKASALHDGRIGASGFSDDARVVYERSGRFITVAEFVLFKVLVRANSHQLLPQRYPSLEKSRLLLCSLDFFLNILCNARLYIWARRQSIGKMHRLEYISELDSEAADFVGGLQGNELTRRGASEMNWIACYPWVLPAPVRTTLLKNYYFSDTAKQCNCFMIKIFQPKKVLIGFMMLRVTDGHLTVPFCYTTKEHFDAMLRVIAEHIMALQVHTLTICNPELQRSLQRLNFPFIAIRKSQRSWILGNVYRSSISENFEMQDGDGDCAFS